MMALASSPYPARTITNSFVSSSRTQRELVQHHATHESHNKPLHHGTGHVSHHVFNSSKLGLALGADGRAHFEVPKLLNPVAKPSKTKFHQ